MNLSYELLPAGGETFRLQTFARYFFQGWQTKFVGIVPHDKTKKNFSMAFEIFVCFWRWISTIFFRLFGNFDLTLLTIKTKATDTIFRLVVKNSLPNVVVQLSTTTVQKRLC